MLPLIGRVRRRRLFVLAAAVLVIFLYLRTAPAQHTTAQSSEPDAQAPAPAPVPASPNEEPAKNDMGADTTPAEAQAPPTQPETAAAVPDKPEEKAKADNEDNEPPAETEEEEDEEEEDDEEEDELPPGVKTVMVGGTKYIDPGSQPMVPMEYGTTARPPVRGLDKIIEELPLELLVGDEEAPSPSATLGDGPLRRRRVVFVGDVHGQREPLDALLDKIHFQTGQDHLVLVGDLVNKGPDSAGVVQRAMDLGASAVRGNHEDRVLAAYDAMQAHARGHGHAPSKSASKSAHKHGTPTPAEIAAEGIKERAAALAAMAAENPEIKIDDSIDDAIDPLEQIPFPHGDTAERKTAASLSPEQAAWLADLPVMLHMGKLASAVQSPDQPSIFNDVVVAHAGLVPDVPLEHQDPYAVMAMRSLVHPADEVRQDRARLVAELHMRAESRGRIRPDQAVNVPQHRADAEFHKMQTAVYGPDLHHPRRPSPRGAPQRSIAAGGNPSPADLVMVPVEGHFRKGGGGAAADDGRVHWATAWNQAQHAKPDPADRTTVIYGHDAMTGLLVPETLPSAWKRMLGGGGNGVRSGSVVTAADTGYTFGLDSGAVYGGKLTALVVQADATGHVRYTIEQVPCPAYAKKGTD